MSKVRIFRPRPTKFSLFTSHGDDDHAGNTRNYLTKETFEIVFDEAHRLNERDDSQRNANVERMMKAIARERGYSARKPEAMPDIGLKLLPFILPRKLREAVAGDLTEDFQTYAARWGRRYAVRWLWWELARLCVCRFGPTAIFTAAIAWFRQKLGL